MAGKKSKASKFATVNRGSLAVLALVGHSPNTQKNIAVIREDANTINGDIGAFMEDVDNLLIINMTQGTARYLKPTEDPALLSILEQVQTHLQKQMARGLVLEMIPEGNGFRAVFKSAPSKEGEVKKEQKQQSEEIKEKEMKKEKPKKKVKVKVKEKVKEKAKEEKPKRDLVWKQK